MIFKNILFIYLCGLLINIGLIYSLQSYGLLDDVDKDLKTQSSDILAKIIAVLLSWITIVIFISGVIKGVYVEVRRRLK